MQDVSSSSRGKPGTIIKIWSEVISSGAQIIQRCNENAYLLSLWKNKTLIVKQYLARFNQSYPGIGDTREALRENLYIGLFVAAFLYLVRPFGIGGYDGPHLWLLCLGFGLVTYVMSVIFNVIVTDLLGFRGDTPSWKLKHWILTMLILIVWIAAGNYIYSLILMGKEYFHWREFLAMLYGTAIIGIFPVAFYGFVNQNRLEKRNKNLAKDISIVSHSSESEVEFVITSKRQDSKIMMTKSSFRYAQAMQNYVRLYLYQDGNVQQEIIRLSLGSLEDQVQDTQIVRCHRSYMVNLDAVQEVSGNAQGLRLTLQDIDEEIPVSRSYISNVKQHLQHSV